MSDRGMHHASPGSRVADGRSFLSGIVQATAEVPPTVWLRSMEDADCISCLCLTPYFPSHNLIAAHLLDQKDAYVVQCKARAETVDNDCLSLLDLWHKAPRALELVHPTSLKTLLAVSVPIRQRILAHITKVYRQRSRPLSADVCLDLRWLTLQSWPNVTHLILRDSGVKDDNVSCLGGSAWPSLTHLDLAENGLTHAGVKTLMQAIFPALTHLDLSSNNFHYNGVAALCVVHFPAGALSDIVAISQQARLHVMQQIPRAFNTFPLLQDLHLSDLLLDGDCMRSLSACTWMLRALHLSYNSLTAVAVQQLAAQKWPGLEQLDLSHNRLGAGAVSALLDVDMPMLSKLNLSRNRLGGADTLKLADGRWPSLTIIDLQRQRIPVGEVTPLPADFCKLCLVRKWPTAEVLV